jgi:hypothetical protein
MIVDQVIVDKMVVDKMTSGSNYLAPKRSDSGFWVASLSPFFIIFVFFKKRVHPVACTIKILQL